MNKLINQELNGILQDIDTLDNYVDSCVRGILTQDTKADIRNNVSETVQKIRDRIKHIDDIDSGKIVSNNEGISKNSSKIFF